MRSGDRMYIQSKKVDGCKHHASRDGVTWGQEESEKAGKERVLGLESRQERRKGSARSCQHVKLQGEGQKNITNIHQCLHALFLHPLCRLHSLLFPVWRQFCFHYKGGNYRNYTPGANALSLPMLLAEAAHSMGPWKSICKSSFTICSLAERYFEDSPWMTWVVPVMPIKKTLCNSLELKKINSSSSAWVLIIHWHCLLPNNNTAWIAAPVPSAPQPEREKGEKKSSKILHENGMRDSQEGPPVASTRKIWPVWLLLTEEVNGNHTLHFYGALRQGTCGPYLFFSSFSL